MIFSLFVPSLENFKLNNNYVWFLNLMHLLFLEVLQSFIYQQLIMKQCMLMTCQGPWAVCITKKKVFGIYVITPITTIGNLLASKIVICVGLDMGQTWRHWVKWKKEGKTHFYLGPSIIVTWGKK